VISQVANVQLSVLQSPEIARAQAPLATQAQLANAAVPGIIAKNDQDAAQTVQALQQTTWHGVPDSLSGSPPREAPTYRDAGRRNRPLGEKIIALAAAHPRGIGALVDVRA